MSLPMSNKAILLRGAALALMIGAGHALAQDAPESLLPPGFEDPVPPPAPRPSAPRPARPAAPPPAAATDNSVGEVDEVALNELVENQSDEPRDDSISASVGISGEAMFDSNLWGSVRGQYLQTIMRELDVPLSSRWAHIGLRNALLAPSSPPSGVSGADWIAERAWLLVRMGEADAARLLIAPVAKSSYSPKLSQVALQVALATSDLGAMCPLPRTLKESEKTAEPLVDAICHALIGQPELATERIRQTRRRGATGGIDVSLVDKLVGAGAGTGRAVTVNWEGVDQLSSWRYGLASATGMTIPTELLDQAKPQLRAWHARAPLLPPADRIASGRIATGLGVFSGQAMIDLYALDYDATDVNQQGSTEAWQLRQAFVASDVNGRLAAMRSFWSKGDTNKIELMAARAVTARAAARIRPSGDFAADAGNLIAAMMASGLERPATRWIGVVGDMDNDDSDLAWAQLALGLAEPVGVDLSEGRIRDFIDRDDSPRKAKSRLLVGGLAGLERISPQLTAELEDDFSLGLSMQTRATRAIDDAGRRREDGTAMLLAALMMQTDSVEHVPAHYMFHLVTALRRSGQPFLARMIAAEAVARV